MNLSIKVRQDECGHFVAWCPALPGCSARGNTSEQAITKLEQAVRGYLSSMDVVAPENLQPHMMMQAQ